MYQGIRSTTPVPAPATDGAESEDAHALSRLITRAHDIAERFRACSVSWEPASVDDDVTSGESLRQWFVLQNQDMYFSVAVRPLGIGRGASIKAVEQLMPHPDQSSKLLDVYRQALRERGVDDKQLAAIEAWGLRG